MTPPEAAPNELKDPGYEIFIAALSVLSILNIVLMYAIRDEALDTVLLLMNILLSVVFLVDFAFRLLTSPSKTDYFVKRFGWADLLASLPFQQLKVLRLFRLVRVFRLLRANGIRVIGSRLMRDRAGSALLSLLLMGILVLEFGSLGMLAFEEDAADGNIATASDAIWYVMVTISTVGYGDQFPVTTSGRILGALVIVIGVGIFGTFTGYLANFFLAPRSAPKEVDSPDDTRERLATLRTLLAEQQAAIDELDGILRRRPSDPGPG